MPHDLKYSADFEDALMSAVFNPNARSEGIRLIPSDSSEERQDGVSERVGDEDLLSRPVIAEDELPLPLNDPRRMFASPVPGVKLTHPGGYLEGGPGLDPELDTFPEDFLSSHPTITTTPELRKAVEEEVGKSMELMKERLTRRKEAKERNEQIEKELKELRDQHSVELKVHNRIAEENLRKREAREKRRREKAGG